MSLGVHAMAAGQDSENQQAWSYDEARQEVSRLSGTHFDPDVAAAFAICFDEILAIRAANPDLS